ncbi:hypothetical protein [Candidatus Nitrotoga arctica]|uniref:Uncharacterized protein n=1 Tax=Candidatus Nitrotoga arctica TaxID=453162 RepID=A0ABN8AJQ5_9PROT|nr:hypothetical protein [Candidatus Nitrotoga arctica]CAG9931826.1 protein of unknown function [Candidatus Nitrotoga arctica]
MVESFEDWRWSSYPFITGQEAPPSWLNADWLLGQFGLQRSKALSGYRQFVMTDRGLPSPMLETRHQLLLGDNAFVERTGRQKIQKSYGKFQRPIEDRSLCRWMSTGCVTRIEIR